MNRSLVASAVLAILLAVGGSTPRAEAVGPTPTIATVTPARGPIAGGTTVTITGTDFAAPMSATFGGTPATSVVVVNSTTLTCITPPHAKGDVNVVVTQTTAPETPSAPAVNAFAYDEPQYYVWVPRAPGAATGGNPGGFDVLVVDIPNRRVAGKIDLNPADVLLPTDNDWSVTQVLFDAAGSKAYLATSGIPGARDSKKIFVVDTALAVDAVAANEVIAVIDNADNPYQLALSPDGKTLYAADGGSWAAAAFPLPAGKFREYDVTNPAAPVLPGASATVGSIPVLHYDGLTQRGWGRNSAHLGRIQDHDGRTLVTNAYSRTLSVVDLDTTTVLGSPSVAGALTAGVTTSVPSPFQDGVVFVETFDSGSGDAEYFAFHLSTSSLVPRGAVDTPVGFFTFTLSPFPKLDVQNRRSWPHPDGESLVAVPSLAAAVASFRPSTGTVPGQVAVAGGGPPSTLAYNDVTDFLYAREADGGWTVLTVPDARGAAPVKAVEIADATGIDSLRVVGDGSWLVGTATSNLAILDGKAASVDLHKVVATIPLDLDAAGGAVFPQPSPTNVGGNPRSFVTLVVDDDASSIQSVGIPDVRLYCADDAPPEFTFTRPDEAAIRYELEIGSQYDFLAVPGARRYRVRVLGDDTTVTPPAGPWRRVLRAAAGDVERPFFARVNAVHRDGSRTFGNPETLYVCEPVPPTATGPANAASADRDAPPPFTFDYEDSGRFWIEFAGTDGFDEGVVARVRVRLVVGGSGAVTPSPRAWRRIVDRVRGKDGTYPVPVEWRVRCIDLLGREVVSDERTLNVSE